MKFRSTRRRAAAIGFACAIGAAAMPATSSATCRAFTKKSIVVNVDANVGPFMTSHVMSAASQWGSATNVDMFQTTNAATADIRVHMIDIQKWPFYRGPNDWGVTTWPCNAAGGGNGQSHVYLDTEVSAFLALGNASARARSLASHELGHALGLGHNDTTFGTCAGGVARPTTVMYSRIVTTSDGGICGHHQPATDDINAINALYK